jgi:hypothetical protein
MKNLKRSLRRHHVARLKAARRFHFGRDLYGNAKALGKVVDTPCPCSCWMCGNPRRKLDELTIHERSSQELFAFETWVKPQFNIQL